MDELFEDMKAKCLISFRHTDWLQRAIEQKSHNLTLSLQYSKPLPLIQDSLSEILATVLPFETTPMNWN